MTVAQRKSWLDERIRRGEPVPRQVDPQGQALPTTARAEASRDLGYTVGRRPARAAAAAAAAGGGGGGGGGRMWQLEAPQMARDAHGGGLLSVRNLDYNVRGHLSPQPQQLQQQQQQGQRQSQQQQQGRPPPLVQVQVGVVQQQGMTGQKRQQELLLRRGQQSNRRAGWVKVYRGNGSKAGAGAAGTGSVKAGSGTAAAAQALGGSSSAAANYFAAAAGTGGSSSSSSGSKLRAGGVNVQVAQQHARDLVWNGQAIYA